MQVDPSICAATYISVKERRTGGGHQQTVHCKAGAARKIYSFFQIAPKKETSNHLHYANTCTCVLLSFLKETVTQESTEYLSKGTLPLLFLCY